MKPIYLDNNSATRPVKVEGAAVWQALDAPYADREVVARLSEALGTIGSVADGVIEVVSTGDEAVASVFYHHFFENVKVSGRHHILYVESSRAPVVRMAERLKDLGCVAIPVSVEEIEKMVNPRVSLLSVPWVDPVTGVINPIEEIAELCKKKEITLHIDASFGIRHMEFEFCGDFVTIDGRAIGASHGGGVIVKKVRGDIGIVPRGRVASEVVFGLAAAIAQRGEMGMEIARLRGVFERRLKKAIPECVIHGEDLMRAPATVAVKFPYVKNELLFFHMVQGGLFATMGGGQIRKLDDQSLSFTLGPETTEEELERAVQMIAGILQKLLPVCEVES